MADAPYIPTPEQIRLACEEIRAEWSDEVREQRDTSKRRVEWEVPGMSERRARDEAENDGE